MRSMLLTLDSWIERASRSGWTWYAKYLSANDTCAMANVRDAGPHLSTELVRKAFPRFSQRAEEEATPDAILQVRIASHGLDQEVRLVWYNSKRIENRASGRDEALLADWGGRDHPMVDENATGSMVLFAFNQPVSSEDAVGCEIWIASSPEEEDELLAVVGPLDPGAGVLLATI